MAEIVVKYEINDDGDCQNCEAVTKNRYCKAFNTEIGIKKSIRGLHKWKQCQACKDYLRQHTSTITCHNCKAKITVQKSFIGKVQCNCGAEIWITLAPKQEEYK